MKILLITQEPPLDSNRVDTDNTLRRVLLVNPLPLLSVLDVSCFE